MTHFVTRFFSPLVLRLSFGINNALKKNTIVGHVSSNKYVPYPFSCEKPKWMSSSVNAETHTEEKAKVKIFFKLKNGEIVEVEAEEGQNVMTVGVLSQINFEGACEGSLCCTTCHVYVKDEIFETLPEPDDKEQDLLDIAPFLKPNSRLSCQIIITKDMEGAVFTLPPATINMQVDKNKNNKS